MAFASGKDVGSMVLEALGLRHQGVKRIVIDIAMDAVVMVYVQHYATEEQVDALVGVLRDAPVEVTSGTAPLEVSLPDTGVQVTQGGHPYRLEYRCQDGSEYSGWDYPTRAAAEEAAVEASRKDATVNVYVRTREGREGRAFRGGRR